MHVALLGLYDGRDAIIAVAELSSQKQLPPPPARYHAVPRPGRPGETLESIIDDGRVCREGARRRHFARGRLGVRRGEARSLRLEQL